MSDLGCVAETYLKMGWSVIPLVGKRPCLQSWEPYQRRLPRLEEIKAWWKRWPEAGIGVVCGKVSGLVVVEVDQEPALDGKNMPPTVIAKSGGKKLPHYYYTHDTKIKNRSITIGGKEAFSVRTDGKYVVAPPSIHPVSKDPYEWVFPPESNSLVDPPKWIIEMSDAVVVSSQNTKDHPLLHLVEAGACAFLNHCVDEVKELAEPLWWAMITQCASFDKTGLPVAHQWSEKYNAYSQKETDTKFRQARREVEKHKAPLTCAYIQETLTYPCPSDCQAIILGVKSPAQYARKLEEKRKQRVSAQKVLEIWGIAGMIVIRQATPLFKILLEGDQVVVLENEDLRSPSKFSWAMTNATLHYSNLSSKEHEAVLQYLFESKEVIDVDQEIDPEDRKQLPSELSALQEAMKMIFRKMDISEDREDLYYQKAVRYMEDVIILRETILNRFTRLNVKPGESRFIQCSKDLGGRSVVIRINQKPQRAWLFPESLFDIPETNTIS